MSEEVVFEREYLLTSCRYCSWSYKEEYTDKSESDRQRVSDRVRELEKQHYEKSRERHSEFIREEITEVHFMKRSSEEEESK